VVVFELPKIREHYLSGWFVFDAVASIPVEMVTVATASNNGKDLKILKVFRLMKIFRLVRLLNLKVGYARFSRTQLRGCQGGGGETPHDCTLRIHVVRSPPLSAVLIPPPLPLSQMIKNLEDKGLVSPSMIRLCKLTVVFLLVSHFGACSYWAFVRFQGKLDECWSTISPIRPTCCDGFDVY
jgi:hypothetical protein